MNDAHPTPLIEDIDAGVLSLRLNRPQAMNALDRELGLRLIDAVTRAGKDPAIRAILITGVGRAFCAGDDIAGLQAFLDGNADDERAASDPDDGYTLYLRLATLLVQCPKPVVAAINGAAFGAGTELLCAADLRCMARSAQIGSGLVRIGAAGNAALLGAVIGEARAFEIYLTARTVSSDEALAIGLVHYLYDDDDFTAQAMALARHLASLPTAVIGLQKRLRNDCVGQPLAHRARLQHEVHQLCLELDDAREGAAAFIDKRPPNFTGS